MSARQQQQHAAIRARAESALSDLYHNATVNYPHLDADDPRYADFQAWFNDVAEQEIEYIRDGGATPGDYHATLAASCNGGKYQSPAARAYYVRTKLAARAAERDDCGMLKGWRVLELHAGNVYLAQTLAPHWDFPARPESTACQRVLSKARRNNALWERISEYGKLYQWGRGGRTLAPDDLVQRRGSSFSIKGDYADDLSITACVDLIRILESFNAHVRGWCQSIPEQWREYRAERDAEELAEKREQSARKAK